MKDLRLFSVGAAAAVSLGVEGYLKNLKYVSEPLPAIG